MIREYIHSILQWYSVGEHQWRWSKYRFSSTAKFKHCVDSSCTVARKEFENRVELDIFFVLFTLSTYFILSLNNNWCIWLKNSFLTKYISFLIKESIKYVERAKRTKKMSSSTRSLSNFVFSKMVNDTVGFEE